MTAKPKPRLLEKHVEEAVCNFLEIDGWRCFKMEQNFNQRKMKVVGERGMPDRLFLRYSTVIDPPYEAHVLWIETKAPGKTCREEQTAWHKAEQKRGALVMVVDDFDAFRLDYFAMGLARRVKV